MCFAFLHLIIMRNIHLDLLSNEWEPYREMVLWKSTCAYQKSATISTVIILYEQNVLCARMVVGGGGGGVVCMT